MHATGRSLDEKPTGVERGEEEDMARIVVDEKKCIQDWICVAECPTQVLGISPGGNHPIATEDFQGNCLRCGHCVAACPTGAFGLGWLAPQDCPPVEPRLEISPSQAEQFLRSRRSIRVFKDEPVERAQLEKLIEVACHAPSAKNVQPWQWIVIETPAEVARLDRMLIDWLRSVMASDPAVAEEMRFPRIVDLWERGAYKMLRNAPHLLIVHVDRSWAYGVEDTALALSYVELFAPALGLGATWSGYFMRAFGAYPPLAQAVPVPDGRRVVGAMMVGRPKFTYHRLPCRKPPRVEWR
jgi:nitroreductase/NAD-dependent dihydropyrimidine dehydrogenase PreA subunit